MAFVQQIIKYWKLGYFILLRPDSLWKLVYFVSPGDDQSFIINGMVNNIWNWMTEKYNKNSFCFNFEIGAYIRASNECPELFIYFLLVITGQWSMQDEEKKSDKSIQEKRDLS